MNMKMKGEKEEEETQAMATAIISINYHHMKVIHMPAVLHYPYPAVPPPPRSSVIRARIVSSVPCAHAMNSF